MHEVFPNLNIHLSSIIDGIMDVSGGINFIYFMFHILKSEKIPQFDLKITSNNMNYPNLT